MKGDWTSALCWPNRAQQSGQAGPLQTSSSGSGLAEKNVAFPSERQEGGPGRVARPSKRGLSLSKKGEFQWERVLQGLSGPVSLLWQDAPCPT